MKRKKWYLMISIFIIVVIIVGISYALWQIVFNQKEDNIVASDCFEIIFEEEENSFINLNKAYPMTESEGTSLKPYQFKLKNICNGFSNYQINMEIMEKSTMPDQVMRIKLNEESSELLVNSVEPISGVRAYKIGEGKLNQNETKEFSLRIWMDENTTIEDNAVSKIFIGKISIVTNYQPRYTESILNGTDPEIVDGLIPVTIDNAGSVYKANESEEWYSYANQQWANAIILEDETQTYKNGEMIPENNIESYFVWIPKYRYKLWDIGNYTSLTNIDTNKVNDIELIFGDYDTKDSVSGECTTPKESENSGNCSVGDYMTHPAFQAFGTKGIWVGKFETGYKDATTTTIAEQNTYNVEKIEIKPNVYSWRHIRPANAFLNSYDYKKDMNSHMMKNTEWGAVAYLQHSAYGSRERVRINNNSSYITGYAAVSEPTCGYTSDSRDCNRYEGTPLNTDGEYTKRYNTEEGHLASTTGNITGIYDMSGGAWEYVMGILLHTNEQPCVGIDPTYTSGFEGSYCIASGTASGIALPEQKYYDSYVYGTDDEHYNRRILGDATGEMGPFVNATYGNQTRQIGSWYANGSYFIWRDDPWIARGNSYYDGSGAGLFAFGNACGDVYSGGGFRLVLAF